MTVNVVDASIGDYDSFTKIWEKSGLSYRPNGRDSRESMGARMRDGREVVLLARDGGDAVGILVATDDGRKGWVNRLAVVPSHRRKGVARALVCEFERRMRGKGISVMCALVEAGNDDSETMFERLGYARHDDIAYYSKRKSDAD